MKDLSHLHRCYRFSVSFPQRERQNGNSFHYLAPRPEAPLWNMLIPLADLKCWREAGCSASDGSSNGLFGYRTGCRHLVNWGSLGKQTACIYIVNQGASVNALEFFSRRSKNSNHRGQSVMVQCEEGRPLSIFMLKHMSFNMRWSLREKRTSLQLWCLKMTIYTTWGFYPGHRCLGRVKQITHQGFI